MLTPNVQRPTESVALFGNGGGTSVLAADAYSDLGLRVAPFDVKTIAALSALELPPGSSVTNPVDCPAGNLRKDGTIAERVLDIFYRLADVQAVVVHVNMTTFVGHGKLDPIDNLIRAALEVQQTYPGRAHFVLVLRTDGEPKLEQLRMKLRVHAGELGVPVYNELTQAGAALAALSRHERFLHSRGL
jgi:acyl-CoA synthetase (NDP forming)